MKIRKSIIALAFLCILVSLLTIGYTTQLYAISTSSELGIVVVGAICLLILVTIYFIILLSQTIKEKYFFMMYDELVKGLKDKADTQEKYIININTSQLPGHLVNRVHELENIMLGQSKNGINYRINKARLDELDKVYTVCPNLREFDKKVQEAVMDAKVKKITDKF